MNVDADMISPFDHPYTVPPTLPLKRPHMRALDVGPPRPLRTDDQLQPPLRAGAQIEMILQQRPDQLAAVLFQARLQLRVLKPARLLARQPVNAKNCSAAPENASNPPSDERAPWSTAERCCAPRDGVGGGSFTDA